MAFFVRIGHGVDHDDVGDRAVGDETLLAVDDVRVALAHRPGLHAEQVGTGVRLGGAERGQQFRFAGEPAQKAFLQLRTAAVDDRQHAVGLGDQQQGRRGAGLGDFFQDHGQGRDRHAGAAVLFRQQGIEQAELGKQVPGMFRKRRCLVEFLGQRRNFPGHDVAHHIDCQSLFFSQMFHRCTSL